VQLRKFAVVLTMPLMVIAYVRSRCGGQLSPGAQADGDARVQAESAVAPGADGLAKVLIGLKQQAGSREEAAVWGPTALTPKWCGVAPRSR